MNKPKPARGQCGTCHWFERMDENTGMCFVRPPMPALAMQQAPGSTLNPKGPQMQLGVQGMVPPVNELGRCAEWCAFGATAELGKGIN